MGVQRPGVGEQVAPGCTDRRAVETIRKWSAQVIILIY